MKIKKVVLTCILVAILLIGGILGWKLYDYHTNVVTVVPVEILSSDWGTDYQQNTGVVTDSMSQSVVPGDDQEVKEIYVKEGQRVKIGDKILSYNMETLELDLELKGYDVQELEFSIKRAERDLTNLKNGIVTDDYDTDWDGNLGSRESLLTSIFMRTMEDEVDVDANAPEYEESDENDSEDTYQEYEPAYSAEELRSMIKAKESEIADLKLQLKEEQLAYDTLKKEVDDGTIKAVVAGIVKEVNDPDMTNEAVVRIVSEDELYVRGVIDEFSYGVVTTGMSISAVSWETGNIFEAQITEISEFPTTDTSYASTSTNPNVSYYPYTAVIVNAPDDIRSGESVTVTFEQGDEVNGGNLYLPLAYVRTEGDSSYVYLRNEKNQLRKQTVEIGQTLYNTIVEVKSGVTFSDYIAFPYGQQVKEGARTEISEDSTDIVY